MKRHLVIFTALAVLTLPGLAGADEMKAISSAAMAAPAERGQVDASELTNLLEEKGVIAPEEQKELTHPMAAPSTEDKATQEYFRTPYRRQGWSGGPSPAP